MCAAIKQAEKYVSPQRCLMTDQTTSKNPQLKCLYAVQTDCVKGPQAKAVYDTGAK